MGGTGSPIGGTGSPIGGTESPLLSSNLNPSSSGADRSQIADSTSHGTKRRASPPRRALPPEALIVAECGATPESAPLHRCSAPAVLFTARDRSAVALPRRAARRCPFCPTFWFSIREAYRKPCRQPRPERSGTDRGERHAE